MNDTHANHGAQTMTTKTKTTGMTEKQQEQFAAFFAARQAIREKARKANPVDPAADLGIPAAVVEHTDEQLTF